MSARSCKFLAQTAASCAAPLNSHNSFDEVFSMLLHFHWCRRHMHSQRCQRGVLLFLPQSSCVSSLAPDPHGFSTYWDYFSSFQWPSPRTSFGIVSRILILGSLRPFQVAIGCGPFHRYECHRLTSSSCRACRPGLLVVRVMSILRHERTAPRLW